MNLRSGPGVDWSHPRWTNRKRLALRLCEHATSRRSDRSSSTASAPTSGSMAFRPILITRLTLHAGSPFGKGCCPVASQLSSGTSDISAPQEDFHGMGQGAIEHCSICNRPMVFLLPPRGAGPRTLQCFDCDRPDPLESVSIKCWLEGELGRGFFVSGVKRPDGERASYRHVHSACLEPRPRRALAGTCTRRMSAKALPTHPERGGFLSRLFHFLPRRLGTLAPPMIRK